MDAFVFLLMLGVSVMAWLSAKLSIVYAIYATHSAEHMLRRMIWETNLSVAVLFVFWGLGLITWVVTLFFIARAVFLIMADWQGIADSYVEIKSMF